MSVGKPLAVVRWMADHEIAVCGAMNRISRPPKVKTFFVALSRLGDGAAWYLLLVGLPLLYGELGLMTSASMIKVGVVNFALYKIIKNIQRAPPPMRGERGN